MHKNSRWRSGVSVDLVDQMRLHRIPDLFSLSTQVSQARKAFSAFPGGNLRP